MYIVHTSYIFCMQHINFCLDCRTSKAYQDTVFGTAQLNASCQFPFINNGKTYYTCTYDDYSEYFDDQPWCSVLTDWDNGHIPGQYGICDDFDQCKGIFAVPETEPPKGR